MNRIVFKILVVSLSFVFVNFAEAVVLKTSNADVCGADYEKRINPVINDRHVVFGNTNAPITIVKYCDLDCPYCGQVYPTLKQVEKHYGEKVRVIFKHLPLDFHPQAMPAALMFEALALQNHDLARKFHDLLYENQRDLRMNGQAWMLVQAKNLGADIVRLEKDLASEAVKSNISADIEEAHGFGKFGTPSFSINGIPFEGTAPVVEFRSIIDCLLYIEN